MRSRILALIVGAALATSLMPAALARPEGQRLIIQGEANTYRDIHLPDAVVVRCCDYKADDAEGGLDIIGFEADLHGSYGGFAIERLRDGRVMYGAVRVPSMDLGDGDVPFFASIGHARKLSAGRYRVHLLGDGKTEVTVDIAGTTHDVHVLTNRPSDVSAELLSFDAQVAHKSQPLDIGTRSAALVAIQSDVVGGQATYLSACITRDEECQMSEEDDRAEDLHISAGSARSGTAVGTSYDRGELLRGSFVRFTVGTVGTSTKAHGFYLILD